MMMFISKIHERDFLGLFSLKMSDFRGWFFRFSVNSLAIEIYWFLMKFFSSVHLRFVVFWYLHNFSVWRRHAKWLINFVWMFNVFPHDLTSIFEWFLAIILSPITHIFNITPSWYRSQVVGEYLKMQFTTCRCSNILSHKWVCVTQIKLKKLRFSSNH